MRGFLKNLLSGVKSPWIDSARVVYDLIPPPVRYGRSYKAVRELFENSEKWSIEELREYQNRQLAILIEHCYNNVPYYSKLFRQLGIIPGDINSPTDLKHIPFLTKDIIRRRKPEFVAKNFYFLDHDPESTSGTTGAPFDFWIDRPTRAIERALALRVLEWVGYRPDDRVAELKEDYFQDPNTISKYFPGSKHLKFSFFRAYNDKLRIIVDQLIDFQPSFIKAFPSSLLIIAKWMERRGLKITPPKYIVTSSENLYPSIRNLAEKVFNAPVIDFYGQNEKVATAFQCSAAKGYHVQMEQSIVELLPIAAGEHEIVGTSLTALGMPFIRYRTGDLTRGYGPACECGRSHPVLSHITGRGDEIIITPEGEIVAPVSMDYAFYHFEDVKEAQVIQTQIDHIEVKIVPWDSMEPGKLESLRSSIESYIGSKKMTISIELVDSLFATRTGKKPFVVSKIDLQEYF